MHLQSISRIVGSMRHQRSGLRLALSLVDFHVLSDVVMDARQEPATSVLDENLYLLQLPRFRVAHLPLSGPQRKR